ncbi:MAG: hypothetical protein KJS97_01735 [Alphaproteobacteria bacterium]|nr:hypothetical protein [Alphaproteobacteria bacterium]
MVWMARTGRGVLAALALTLALIASGARGVLPAGYMVNAGLQPGEIAIVLCAAHGDDVAALDVQTGALRSLDEPAGPKPAKASGDAPCVFAVAAAAGRAEGGPSLPVPAGRIVLAVELARDAPHAAFGLAAPPPPSTGPPTTQG